MEKKTTFNKELFDKAQSDGKVVVISSWVKYCSSCASQMKVLDKAKNEFDNIEYIEIMNNLNLKKPLEIDYNVASNLKLGA